MKPKYVSKPQKGSMAEWSNASDSSSDSFGSAGSNPAGTNIGYHTAITIELRIKLDCNFASRVRIPPHLPRVCIQVVKGGFQTQWYPITKQMSP